MARATRSEEIRRGSLRPLSTTPYNSTTSALATEESSFEQAPPPKNEQLEKNKATLAAYEAKEASLIAERERIKTAPEYNDPTNKYFTPGERSTALRRVGGNLKAVSNKVSQYKTIISYQEKGEKARKSDVNPSSRLTSRNNKVVPAGQQPRDIAIQEKTGLTPQQVKQLQPSARKAIERQLFPDPIRRIAKDNNPYKGTIGGKTYIGTEAFLRAKIAADKDKFYIQRAAETQRLTNLGFTAKDFFPNTAPTRKQEILTISQVGAENIASNPLPRRSGLTRDQIIPLGHARRAELINQRQQDFFGSEGFDRINLYANKMSFGRGTPFEKRSFIGKASQTLVGGALGGPIALGGLVVGAQQKFNLARDINLFNIRTKGIQPTQRLGGGEVGQELLINAPQQVLKTTLNPATPEGAATFVAAGIGALGVAAPKLGGAPKTTGPLGKAEIDVYGRSPSITSKNLIPEPKLSSVTRISYAERTTGLIKKPVQTTIRIGETGAVKTQIIGKTRYTIVDTPKGSLITKTLEPKGFFLSQKLTKGTGKGDFIDFTIIETDLKTSSKSVGQAKNVVLNKANLKNQYFVESQLSGKQLTGIFNSELIGSTRITGGRATTFYRENLVARDVLSGRKTIVEDLTIKGKAPIKLLPGEEGTTFAKVFSRSEQEGLGLRINEKGELFTDVRTRSRIASLEELKIQSAILEKGQGDITPISRPSLLQNRRGVFDINREIQITRRPTEIEIRTPTRGPGIRDTISGRRSLPTPRTTLPLTAPIILTTPLTRPITTTKQQQEPLLTRKTTTITTPDFEYDFNFRTGQRTRITPSITERSFTTTTPTTTPLLFRPFTPAPTPKRPPNTPGFDVPGLPIPFGFGFGGSSYGKSGKAYLSNRKLSFTPDLPSIDLGITGTTATPIGGFTGLEVRKIRRSTPKKRRRKKR